MKHFTDDDLIDYLHGELGDAADVRVHLHLAECADCRSRCDAEASVGELLRGSALAQERELPSFVRAAVWASIRAAEPTIVQRLGAFFRPAVAVPLAATFALLAYFGIPVVRSTQSTGGATISVLYYLDEHAAAGQQNPLADRVNANSLLASAPSTSLARAPLIDAADAATLDDVASARK